MKNKAITFKDNLIIGRVFALQVPTEIELITLASNIRLLKLDMRSLMREIGTGLQHFGRWHYRAER